MNTRRFTEIFLIQAGLIVLIYRTGYYFGELAYSSYYTTGLLYFLFFYKPYSYVYVFPYPSIAAVLLIVGIISVIDEFRNRKKQKNDGQSAV